MDIKMGGGLALGIAAIGAGVFAYNKHKKNEEEASAPFPREPASRH